MLQPPIVVDHEDMGGVVLERSRCRARCTNSLVSAAPSSDRVARALLGMDHCGQKGESEFGPQSPNLQRQREPSRLNLSQSQRQAFTVRCRRSSCPSSPVSRAGPRSTKSVDEFPQDAVEALLGHPQYFQ